MYSQPVNISVGEGEEATDPLTVQGAPNGFHIRLLLSERLGASYQETNIPVDIESGKNIERSVLSLKSVGFFSFDRVGKTNWAGGFLVSLGSPYLECHDPVCRRRAADFVFCIRYL